MTRNDGARGDARKRLALLTSGVDAAPADVHPDPLDSGSASENTTSSAPERERLARKAAEGGILTIRDLCGDADLERYDAHDYCTRHDVHLPTDGICPVTLGILAAVRAEGAVECLCSEDLINAVGCICKGDLRRAMRDA